VEWRLKKAIEETTVPKVDVEVQVKAIELVRSVEARNPNDLVLKLKIPLDIAEKLFNRIVENEGITTTLILDAVRELGDLVEEAKELKEALRGERSKLPGEILKLQDLIDEARKLVEELKELKKLGVEIAKLPEYLRHLQELRRKFKDLKKSFENTSNRTTQLENKYRRLNEKVGDLEKSLNSLRRDRKLLEMGLEYRFVSKEHKCAYMDDKGYCVRFAYTMPPEGLAPESIKAVVEEGKIYYYINVERNRLICALCPRYTPQAVIQQIRYSTKS
jgi:superfamily I DNA/RNA helicase